MKPGTFGSNKISEISGRLQVTGVNSVLIAGVCCNVCLQARIAADLIELRNKSVFAFFMFNALFVLIVFLLQLNKDMLHVDWPLGVKTNITYIEETAEVKTRQ
jgi:hydrogenase-4 membrane subunit HyfE